MGREVKCQRILLSCIRDFPIRFASIKRSLSVQRRFIRNWGTILLHNAQLSAKLAISAGMISLKRRNKYVRLTNSSILSHKNL